MAFLARIAFDAFRNYDTLNLGVSPAPVVLVGENGEGKTNCLEAISLLAPGRGLRGATLAEVQNQKLPRPWAVSFQLHGYEGETQLGLGLDPENHEKRLIRQDGKTLRGQTALARHVNVLWLTPERDRLLAESLTERRRFMDRLVYALHPDHLTHLNRYEEALRSRNHLLQEGNLDDRWMNALEDAMARDGVAIAAARLHWAESLLPFMQDDPAPFPRLSLHLEGLCEQKAQEMAAVDVEDFLRTTWRGSRRTDQQSGTTAAGPHRTALMVRHIPNNCLAEQCSTGEQKALIISLVMAQARLLTHLHRQPPLLLFDDVMAHLDQKRRQALCGQIMGLGAQAWLSGTDTSFFGGFAGAAQVFEVKDARISPLDGNA